MSKFLTGKDLEDAIYDIIWEAEKMLLIVSPFVKLDDYFKELFDKHQNNPKIHLVLVFGKNEKSVNKSMSQDDFDYFKKFPNVSIIYVPNLHAKYYGNEKKGVITSINLYDYSFKNNIEFGVFSQQSLLNNLTNSADNDAWHACMDLVEQNEVVFIKRPVYESMKILINIGKSYIKSDVLHDSTDKFYGGIQNRNGKKKTILDFPEKLEMGTTKNVRPEREKKSINKVISVKHGYCIRTGTEIPFNIDKPMSYEAYKIWSQFEDPDYPEKFCHFSGEPSNGNTSVSRPILNKNWRKAKEIYNL